MGYKEEGVTEDEAELDVEEDVVEVGEEGIERWLHFGRRKTARECHESCYLKTGESIPPPSATSVGHSSHMRTGGPTKKGRQPRDVSSDCKGAEKLPSRMTACRKSCNLEIW